MTKKNNILGVIPARGGSKGIPNKNIYPINGFPLISYTIKTALQSKLLSRCIVSTDSNKIANVAKEYHADVPFIRPQQHATDQALAIDVIKHAVLEMESLDNCQYDYIVMLQPTTPLKIAEDIDAVINKLIKANCDTVVSLVDVGADHPARMYTIESDKMVPVMDEGVVMSPRQDLPSIYIRNGAVYACKRDVIFEHNAMIGTDCRGYVMPAERSVNIDVKTDLILAEYYLKNSS
ncbi:N-acylneuraminate cytidylyltransferase [bacterium K02(2017)]|nr:N-acylneuraminate cytidylyltransferase [bacterium K02(2017)]